MLETEKMNAPEDPLEKKFDKYVANFFLLLIVGGPISVLIFPKLITLIICFLVAVLYLLYGLIVCKKNFRLHIRSFEDFGSWAPYFWFFLGTLIMGWLFYLLIGGSENIETLFNSGTTIRSRCVGLIPGLWIAMLCLFLSYEEIKPSEKKQQEIDAWHEQGFKKDPFSFVYLHKLMDAFKEGKDQAFFEKSPLHAAKIFEAAQYLEQLEETGKEFLTTKICYQLGMMYEIGFACPPNPAKAIACYKKAITAATLDPNTRQARRYCKRARNRLENLQKSN